MARAIDRLMARTLYAPKTKPRRRIKRITQIKLTGKKSGPSTNEDGDIVQSNIDRLLAREKEEVAQLKAEIAAELRRKVAYRRKHQQAIGVFDGSVPGLAPLGYNPDEDDPSSNEEGKDDEPY